MIRETIVQEAKKLIGEREKPKNSGFVNEDLEKEMIAMGWNKGWAWCVFATKLIYFKAYSKYEKTLALITAHIFSPSAVATLENFRKAGWEISQTPSIGSLVVWQKYKKNKKSWQGHIGVVIDFNDDNFITVEGNTNVRGSREGDGFMKKTRNYDFDKQNGLRLIGFVHPKSV